MFNKTLLAVSILGLTSNAMALTITETIADVISETNPVVFGAPTIDAVATRDDYQTPGFTVNLDANYVAGNTIAVTYSGDLDEDFEHDTVALTLVTSGDANAGDCVDTGFVLSFGGYSASTKTATYQFATASNPSLDCSVAFLPVEVDGASLASADTFSISVAGNTTFGVFESAKTAKLADVAPVGIANVVTTPLNAIIDVENGRTQFTYTGTSTAADTIAAGDLRDTVTFTTTGDNTAATLDDADLVSVTTVVTGDMTWAKTYTAEGVLEGYTGITASGHVADTLIVTDTTATFKHTVAAESTAVALTFEALTGDDKVSLSAGDYSSVTSWTYKNGGADAADNDVVLNGSSSAAIGSWTLNGASVAVYGIPNSPASELLLHVSNSGTSTGAITVDLVCDSKALSTIAAGNVIPRGTVSISEAVMIAARESDCGKYSRYDATVTVNAPKAHIKAVAGYKIVQEGLGDDRLGLETSQSLK